MLLSSLCCCHRLSSSKRRYAHRPFFLRSSNEPCKRNAAIRSKNLPAVQHPSKPGYEKNCSPHESDAADAPEGCNPAIRINCLKQSVQEYHEPPRKNKKHLQPPLLYEKENPHSTALLSKLYPIWRLHKHSVLR